MCEYKKLSYRWQTARRICAKALEWITSLKHAPPHIGMGRGWSQDTRPSHIGTERGWSQDTPLPILRWGVADPKTHAPPLHVLPRQIW